MTHQEEIQCDVLVIGAGVVGLSVAARLPAHLNTIIVEAYSKFGQETSSRNSEVVHSGIYYPKESLKTQLCIDGRTQLYAFCEKMGISYLRMGKIIVAVSKEEEEYLESMYEHCVGLSVPVHWMSAKEISKTEPLVKVTKGLFFPESGVVDSHALMLAQESSFLKNGGVVAYSHKVTGVCRKNEVWEVVVEAEGTKTKILAQSVINAAGLSAANLSNQALLVQKYEHRFCRGRYFGLRGRYQNKFRRLIYPVPPKDGLGIHVTVDLTGAARLGPDTDWCSDSKIENISQYYQCDWEPLKKLFVKAVNRYCSSINQKDLLPGMVGIRPKLFIDGNAYPDFLLENRNGFIHCLGIESPGLTACLAIAERVMKLVEKSGM